MANEIKLLIIVFLPLIGCFLLPLLGMLSSRLRNIVSLLLVAIPFLLSLQLIPTVLTGQTITIYKALPLGLNFILTVDSMAVFMAAVSTFISSIIVLYSFDYISHYENQNEYYLMVLLFIGAMNGLVFSGNLIFLYTFWEITSITSWRLIGFFRKEDDVYKSNKAFLVTVFGALLMLLGFIIIYSQAGSFDISVLRQYYGTTFVPNLVIVLVLFGILSKSATLPLHTWLPDAGVAPSPITAMLHAAILVKIGIYVFIRLFVFTFTYDPIWHVYIPLIAGVSAIVSAGAAMVDTDMKRIIAYSTVSQIGFILLGLSIGNEMALAGGILNILMHGMAKGGLFLCAGIIEQNTKTKDITQMGGLIKTMPFTAISFLLCSVSVMGIPPFGGFFSKYMIIVGAIKSGHLYIALTFVLGAFLTVIYLLRIFNAIFTGEVKIAAKEGSTTMVACVVLLAALSLLGGILIKYPMDFVDFIVVQLWSH